MSANTVPATSWSSQLTSYANERWFDHDLERGVKTDPSEPQLPLLYKARVIVIGTGLTLVATAETVALGVFTGISLIAWPVTNKPYKFFAERLDSSSFIIVFNLFRIANYGKPDFVIQLQDEISARFEILNGRFIRKNTDYAALLMRGVYPPENSKTYKLREAMYMTLGHLCYPHANHRKFDSLDPALRKILFEYDASQLTLDLLIKVMLKTRPAALPEETRIQLQILGIFEAKEGKVHEGTYFPLSYDNHVQATAKHIAAFKELETGAKTKEAFIHELFEIERSNPAWQAVLQALPEQLRNARIQRGAEILADAVFDAHQMKWTDSYYHRDYCEADKNLPTKNAEELIQAFKEKKPGMKDFVLFRALVNDRQRRADKKLADRSAAEIASFFEASVQENVGALMNASREDLEAMLKDDKTPGEYHTLITQLMGYRSGGYGFYAESVNYITKSTECLKHDQCFLFTNECWNKAIEILDHRLKQRKKQDAEAAAPRRFDDRKD